jgi:regulation of enolase protein 1 (concanavalin A-like superfamily)
VDRQIQVPELPYPVTAIGDASWTVQDGTVRAVAAPTSDIFADPAGGTPQLDAARVVGELPDGDLQLRCRVDVDFAAEFDAGVLLLWFDDAHWAKLCFEYSPAGEPTIVSVVNRAVSDDANAFTLARRTAWLRVSRINTVWTFHASADGETWRMVRLFALDVPGVRPQLGFEVQSPAGDGCRVRFADIRFDAATLSDLRGGS